MKKCKPYVTFEEAEKLFDNGYRNSCEAWFYVTTDRLYQRYDRGACLAVYHKGEAFSNEVDAMVTEGEYIPAPSHRNARRFYFKKLFEKLLINILFNER